MRYLGHVLRKGNDNVFRRVLDFKVVGKRAWAIEDDMKNAAGRADCIKR